MSIRLGNGQTGRFLIDRGSLNNIWKIYIITNIVNNKVYIGQTKNSIYKRFAEHAKKYKKDSKLYKAISKYGKDCFSVGILDFAYSEKEAIMKESEFIKAFNSTNNNIGYNSYDGFYTPTSINKKIICLETGMVFESFAQAADFFNAAPSFVSNVVGGRKNTVKGFHLVPFVDGRADYSKMKTNNRPFKTKIVCVETGKVFDSVKDASRYVNIADSAIHCCLKGRYKTAGKFHWNYYKGDNL